MVRQNIPNGQVTNRAVRTRLDELVRQSGEGYAALSRRLGRNPAYIQQFIKRGVPLKLSETDRRIIANHFGVSEASLGAPEAAMPGGSAPVAAPVVVAPDSGTAAAFAAIPFLASHAARATPLIVDRQFLQRPPGGRSPMIYAHSIEGDGMVPTLFDGDQVLVDTADTRALRDGIYVIDSDGVLLVKRLSVNPGTRRIAILSDNAAYPSFPDCDPAEISVIGRVIWMGRKLA
jgi:SOS-response transcriptional repressor LexA